jgi:AraC family carnitine catabolism transcriptional activator
MENNLSNTLSLKEISEIVDISPRQLNRLFKKNLNKTTMDVYRKLRLELAQKLLKQSEFSITEIAFSCGFSSSSQISQSFKEKFGVMPSQYKNL